MFKKKNLLLTLAAALALQSSVSANNIEEGKEFYTAIKAPSPIVLDGDLSEWRGAMLVSDPGFHHPEVRPDGDDGELIIHEEWAGGTWTGPDDHTSAVRVVYDDDNIYFGFAVTDDYHENAANSAWNGDSVQLMIANEARDTQIALYNYALGGIEGELGDIIVNHEAGPATGADVPPTEAIVKRDEATKSTIYEIKLPKETLGLTELKGGVRFGLGMSINDGDEDTPGQKGFGGLGVHSVVHGKNPEQTALVTLATANNIEPGKEYYFANPLPKPENFVLDGELTEWSGIPVLSDPRFYFPEPTGRDGELILHEEWQGGTWTGPNDQTSAVQIAYDENNLYFGFTVTDDYHENAANSAWNGDSVQLMIANNNQDTQIALYNYALGGIETELGDIIVNHEAGPAAGADPVAVTDAVVKRNTETKQTTYEIVLPKETLGFDILELGTQFGLGMSINDGDEDTPGQKGFSGLGVQSVVHGKDPEQTALVTLGIGGGSTFFYSAINASINTFSFRTTDLDDSIVDPATAKLTINGTEVTLAASAKNNGSIDWSYSTDNFEPNTVLDYSIQIADANGTVVPASGTITSPSFGLLRSTMLATDVDTSKKGFIYSVWQSDLFSHGNSISTVIDVLAEAPNDIDGSTLENDAFKDEKGPATSAGVDAGHLIQYEIPTVINLNAFLNGVDLGNFQPDDQMPGVPGNFDSYDGVAVEILTFVDFPEGLLTMGVNSDDGFEIQIGHIDDPRVMIAGSFQGGRGSSDTTFLMDVRAAGIYPVRLVYFSQGGDASVEIFTLNDAGEKVLVNDTDNGGLAAYREGTVPDFVAAELPAALVASSNGALTEPTVVDFGALEGDTSYSFHFTAVKGGASTAVAGNDAFAVKLDQWNEQGVFGTTEFGVADNLFTAVEGQSAASVFDRPVHVVIVSDTGAGESRLYVDGVHVANWAGNFVFSGDTKVMGARLEQVTDHFGDGSVMFSWATYQGKLTADEVSTIFAELPDVTPKPAILSLDGVPAEGSGLDGRYWQAEPKAIANLQDLGGDLDIGLKIINNWYPNGTFTATGLSFQGGNDLTEIRDWLQDDGASYVGGDGNMDDGVLSLTGYIRIDNPGEVAIRSESDDGSVIWIAGTKVVDNDGGHGAPGPSPDGSYNFEVAGLYPIEIAYFNGDWTSAEGDHGGANLAITADGNPIPGQILYSAADLGATAIAASSIASEAGDAGLHGAYWTTEPKGMQFGEDAQGPIFQTVPGDDHGLVMFGSQPQGRFISTNVSYTGHNDLTPILDWLGGDSASFIGEEGVQDDSLFQFNGFLNITEAGQHSFSSSSDDGSVVRIGNQVVVNNDGGHGQPGPAPDGNAFFPVAGLYPIEIAYFNGDWTSAAGDHGGANIDMTMNGGSLADHILQPLGGLPAITAGGISSIALAEDGMVVIEFDGTLKSSDSATGPYNAVEGATSPATIAPDQAAQFYIAE